MENFQQSPLKLYIQDIFRAETTSNRYIYKLFSFTFKNVMIHGVVTSVYNTTATSTNLELSDATGTVNIYYDTTKSNTNLKEDVSKELLSGFANATRQDDYNLPIMSTLLDRITKKPLDFSAGSYLSVIGDIFLDDKGMRMISAYECRETTVERDLVWMEELRYLYDKYYLPKMLVKNG